SAIMCIIDALHLTVFFCLPIPPLPNPTLFPYTTLFRSYSFEPTFGGHWLITGKRTALYASFEQSLFLSPRHVTIIQPDGSNDARSEEHTSELQSRFDLVCRLLLEKKNI